MTSGSTDELCSYGLVPSCTDSSEGSLMSFDMTFWYASEPPSDQIAADVYDQLTDGDLNVVERSPALQEFLEEVLAVYPDLTEENAEESPWASSVYSNEECV